MPLNDKMVAMVTTTNTPIKTRYRGKIHLSGFLRIKVKLLKNQSQWLLASEDKIPKVMIKLIPLPIPLSVICSPIHIKNIVPVVMVKMTIK